MQFTATVSKILNVLAVSIISISDVFLLLIGVVNFKMYEMIGFGEIRKFGMFS